MLKTLAILVLIVIICLGTTASAFALGASGSEDNWFNTAWRPRLAKVEGFRTIFNLHDDGDAKSEYLGTRTEYIAVIRKPYVDPWFAESVWQQFSQKITEVTGKPVQLLTSADSLPSHSAPLYIYLESMNEENPLTLGKTYNERGIILYKQGLEEFSAAAPETKELYVMSTLLHEFGHQIGLVHNEKPDCLMNSHAETRGNAKLVAREIVTNFCAAELDQINVTKRELK